MNLRRFFKKIKHFGVWTKPFLLDIGEVGFIIAIAFFVFEITQSNINKEIEVNTARWFIPTILTVSVSIILVSIFILKKAWHASKRHVDGLDSAPPAEQLANAILAYGKQLHDESRDRALVNLRNSFSHTLHVLGYYSIRISLGEIALRSAVILNDSGTKGEILIDDLGWANYLLGNVSIAIANIERGVQIAQDAPRRTEEERIKHTLCQAKGLRHLALIDYRNNPTQAQGRLQQALSILTELSEGSAADIIKRDIAQIYHAKALVLAMLMEIHKEGKVRPGDIEGVQVINDALEQVRNSAKIFQSIGDLERYAKALILEVRLLEAKGEFTEAKEVSAIRDRTLAASEWVRLEASEKTTGV